MAKKTKKGKKGSKKSKKPVDRDAELEAAVTNAKLWQNKFLLTDRQRIDYRPGFSMNVKTTFDGSSLVRTLVNDVVIIIILNLIRQTCQKLAQENETVTNSLFQAERDTIEMVSGN